ncbi:MULTISPECIES: sigma-70 family RNA polymerase sigma factor [Alcaligenaceae]|uniref:sigma-70 family RNA polymerase sigma factor n=1 Tax=Bordetella genomosp. 10 TaxID=1416804 RepID=UPI00279587EE|nr:sigma-70 family RNA polymerase sigma factor [Bordetella genomosp. 10]
MTVETLYCDHHGWLHGWLRRRLGNAFDAADLAQDTFVRVLNNREGPEGVVEPRAFLTRIAQRVLANHWRREQLERAYLEALASAPPGFELSPEERALLLEALVEIDRLLNGLPAVVKRAFLLTQLDGMKHAEVAEALGVSVTTVKRYLARAGEQLYFGAADAMRA